MSVGKYDLDDNKWMRIYKFKSQKINQEHLFKKYYLLKIIYNI